MPSKKLVTALIENGFYIDSSVAKGHILKSNVCDIDYSKAKSNFMPWRINPININQHQADGKLIEFPIFTSKRFLPLRFIDKKL